MNVAWKEKQNNEQGTWNVESQQCIPIITQGLVECSQMGLFNPFRVVFNTILAITPDKVRVIDYLSPSDFNDFINHWLC